MADKKLDLRNPIFHDDDKARVRCGAKQARAGSGWSAPFL